MGCRRITSIISSMVLTGAMAACSTGDFTQFSKTNTGGGGDGWDPGTARPNVFDFGKECGIPQANQDDPNLTLVKGLYESLPIVVEGKTPTLEIPFRVVTTATVAISSTTLETNQQQDIAVVDAAASGIIASIFGPGIAKGDAETAAKANSGKTKSTMMPSKDWFKLTNGSNAEYKDVLCVVSGVTSISIERNDATTGSVTFTPALVSSVNPMAPIARMRLELGAGKVFHVTAEVQGTVAGLKAGSSTGTVTIRETTPSFTQSGKTLTTPIAWEIVNDFPGGAFTVGLPKRQVFYVDPVTKTLAAIVNETDLPDSNTKLPLPPTYLIKAP